jgi:hypothetical protein
MAVQSEEVIKDKNKLHQETTRGCGKKAYQELRCGKLQVECIVLATHPTLTNEVYG